MACVAHMMEGIWFDGPKVLQEEYNYQVYLAKRNTQNSAEQTGTSSKEATTPSCVAQQIAQARERIHQTLQGSDTTLSVDASTKLQNYESENAELRKLVDSLIHRMAALESRLAVLESKDTDPGKAEVPPPPVQEKQAPSAVEEESSDEDSDDLFASDEESEDEDAKKLREERLAQYQSKKAKKPALIPKSNIIMDVKPWDDTTDMAELEKKVRSIATDGLIWGPSKLMDVAFGIKKLQISCVVEDDKVGTDFLEDSISNFEDLVQSMDVVAFNKV